jgi:DNA-binding NtrC family response regulator
VLRALDRTRLERENRELLERMQREWRFENLIGSGPAHARVFDTIRKVAETDLTVLVRGESGTGKELVAQALHHAARGASGVRSWR